MRECLWLMQTYFSPFLTLIVCFSLVKHSLPHELVVLNKIATGDNLAPHPDHDKYLIHVSNLFFSIYLVVMW